MVLTRDFRDTIQARAIKDPAFSKGLLEESMNEFLSGDLYTAIPVPLEDANLDLIFVRGKLQKLWKENYLKTNARI